MFNHIPYPMESPMNLFRNNTYVFDFKQGDVNGDCIPDHIYLIGEKESPDGIFQQNITLVIQDGLTKKITTVPLKVNAGYNARLFIGDFTKDHVEDIKISIDSGGSGGYGFFYVYSFENNILKEIFDFEKYNALNQYNVDYRDFYRVDVASVELDKLFTLDISHKGYDYLSQYYDENGKLLKPVQGQVLALGALFPIVTNGKNNNFDLLAFQRIIGTFNADTLGYVENLLTWDSEKFISSRILVSIPGTKLITPY